MIELLLAAERLLAADRPNEAGRLFEQVAEADPRNAIAVVGLARVALERGDRPGALATVRRALEIDPDDPAARRLAARLSIPEPAPGLVPDSEPQREPARAPGFVPDSEPQLEPERESVGPPRRTLLDRLLGLLRLR